MLPSVRVAILCGTHAQCSWKRLARRHPATGGRCRTVSTYQTSNQAFWVAEPEQPARKLRQLYAFAEAALLLG